MGNNGAIIELHNDNRASAHSQAHLQFAQANAETKNCKRACLFSIAFFADPEKQNRDCAKLRIK